MKNALRPKLPAALVRAAAGLAVVTTVATSPVPALAQDQSSEARLRKIEAEIRALQRSVFPGGDGRFFEPQITSGEGTTQPANTSAPSTNAVTDLLARLDAMEVQLQRLTALTEENTNAIALMETRLAGLETSAIPAPAMATGSDDSEAPATDTNLAAMTGGASSADGADDQPEDAAPPTSGPSAERLAAVQEITKPQTDDAADDEYSYGFRLWNAGFYPEARQQLSRFVEQYPDHWRVTWGRNLLGRAFLARWFLRNYQADRTAPRAPDSLLFLAEAMIAMEDTRRACIALAEFGETYPAVASGRLMDQYEANRRRVTCEE